MVLDIGTYAYPTFGHLPVSTIDTTLVCKVLDPIWRTKTETASRLRGRIESILDHARVRGQRTGENPARWHGHLELTYPSKGEIAPVKHHSSLPYVDMPAFWPKLQVQDGIGARALEFAILTAGRTGEVLGARWQEIDLDARVWRVPPERMKAGKEHSVPLSDPAIALLRKLAAVRAGDLVFPGQVADRPLSNMAMHMALRRMKVDATPHGFRSTFRTWVAEQTNFPHEVAEAALAHTQDDKVVAAYQRGDFAKKRAAMMAAWANYLGTGATSNVVSIGRRLPAEVHGQRWPSRKPATGPPRRFFQLWTQHYRRCAMSAFTLWNAPQACLWIASQDDAAVSSLPENYTFAVLGFQLELELIDSDEDHAVLIDVGMTFDQLLGLRDQLAEYLGPSKADIPGTAWIGRAQNELLTACANGALKMTGRPLYGGPSREIPAEAFATFRFFERDGVDCLGPPDLVDADCWRDLRLLPEDARRVWPAEGSADAAPSPSIPATASQSAASPTYAPDVKYSPDKVPDQFTALAPEQHEARVVITEALAQDAMRGAEDRDGNRSGGLLAPGAGQVRETDDQIRDWMIRYQRDLKDAGKLHGRDFILLAARKRFGVRHKVVLAIWNAQTNRKPGRPRPEKKSP